MAARTTLNPAERHTMALYTLLIRIDEDERSVRYRFGPDEDHLGVVELHKQAEIVNELQPVPGATSKTDLSNARKLLFRLLRSGHGFPETAAYEA